ncbi:MAG: PspC domain-containing protein [Tannerellaceae bacterium]
MKKTLTVNLGGTVFHIDEDAYQLLDKYLSNLRIHFKKEEGSEEIMSDFEMRISELLTERVRLGHEVITIEHVEEVIKRMGKPEELFDDDNAQPHVESKSHATFSDSEQGTTRKRLMRDPDNRLLGGVAGGIAAYLNCDVTAIRLAMILLIFIPYAPVVIIYIILWLVMPQAHTAADRLIMRGEHVTLENIGRTVTNGFEKVSNNVNDYISSGQPRSGVQKLADVFVAIVGGVLKFAAILIGIILLPVLLLVVFILVVVLIALAAGGVGLSLHFLPFFDNSFLAGLPEQSLIFGSIGCIILLGLPFVALLYALCSQIFKFRPMPTGAKWVLLLIWIAALVSCIYAWFKGIPFTGFHGSWGNWYPNAFPDITILSNWF